MHHLRKWTQDKTITGDHGCGLRDILDWAYYRERLANTIRKIITIPAAEQGVDNPVPRVPHPEWLRKKIRDDRDPMKQQTIETMFGMSKAKQVRLNETRTRARARKGKGKSKRKGKQSVAAGAAMDIEDIGDGGSCGSGGATDATDAIAAAQPSVLSIGGGKGKRLRLRSRSQYVKKGGSAGSRLDPLGLGIQMDLDHDGGFDDEDDHDVNKATAKTWTGDDKGVAKPAAETTAKALKKAQRFGEGGPLLGNIFAAAAVQRAIPSVDIPATLQKMVSEAEAAAARAAALALSEGGSTSVKDAQRLSRYAKAVASGLSLPPAFASSSSSSSLSSSVALLTAVTRQRADEVRESVSSSNSSISISISSKENGSTHKSDTAAAAKVAFSAPSIPVARVSMSTGSNTASLDPRRDFRSWLAVRKRQWRALRAAKCLARGRQPRGGVFAGLKARAGKAAKSAQARARAATAARKEMRRSLEEALAATRKRLGLSSGKASNRGRPGKINAKALAGLAAWRERKRKAAEALHGVEEGKDDDKEGSGEEVRDEEAQEQEEEEDEDVEEDKEDEEEAETQGTSDGATTSAATATSEATTGTAATASPITDDVVSLALAIRNRVRDRDVRVQRRLLAQLASTGRYPGMEGFANASLAAETAFARTMGSSRSQLDALVSASRDAILRGRWELVELRADNVAADIGSGGEGQVAATASSLSSSGRSSSSGGGNFEGVYTAWIRTELQTFASVRVRVGRRFYVNFRRASRRALQLFRRLQRLSVSADDGSDGSSDLALAAAGGRKGATMARHVKKKLPHGQRSTGLIELTMDERTWLSKGTAKRLSSVLQDPCVSAVFETHTPPLLRVLCGVGCLARVSRDYLDRVDKRTRRRFWSGVSICGVPAVAGFGEHDGDVGSAADAMDLDVDVKHKAKRRRGKGKGKFQGSEVESGSTVFSLDDVEFLSPRSHPYMRSAAAKSNGGETAGRNSKKMAAPSSSASASASASASKDAFDLGFKKVFVYHTATTTSTRGVWAVFVVTQRRGTAADLKHRLRAQQGVARSVGLRVPSTARAGDVRDGDDEGDGTAVASATSGRKRKRGGDNNNAVAVAVADGGVAGAAAAHSNDDDNDNDDALGNGFWLEATCDVWLTDPAGASGARPSLSAAYRRMQARNMADAMAMARPSPPRHAFRGAFGEHDDGDGDDDDDDDEEEEEDNDVVITEEERQARAAARAEVAAARAEAEAVEPFDLESWLSSAMMDQALGALGRTRVTDFTLHPSHRTASSAARSVADFLHRIRRSRVGAGQLLAVVQAQSLPGSSSSTTSSDAGVGGLSSGDALARARALLPALRDMPCVACHSGGGEHDSRGFPDLMWQRWGECFSSPALRFVSFVVLYLLSFVLCPFLARVPISLITTHCKNCRAHLSPAKL